MSAVQSSPATPARAAVQSATTPARATVQSATLLRIFLGEMARHKSQPLYEAIVLKAREMHLAGATVLRGPLGYGRSSRIHTHKILRLSEDLPIVIEIVDAPSKIDAFLPVLDQMMTSGLVTLEQIHIISRRDQEVRV